MIKLKKRNMTALLLCLSLLIAAVQFSTVDSALPCNSPLRRLLPQEFTHCPSCSYGQWSRWTTSIPLQVRVDHTCESGKAKKYEHSKTAVRIPGSTCTRDTVKEYKYECEPTLTQKAELIIQSLRLGVDADSSTRSPTPRPVTRPAPTQTTYVTTRGSWFRRRVYRSRYSTPRPPPVVFNKYCPTASRQANNRICPNMCPIGKRSLEEDEEFTTINAPELQILDAAVQVEPFNMEERVSAIHERRHRQACPNPENLDSIRYVLFIVDTSGSIGSSRFASVIDVLANMSSTLCDHLRVAMITYSHEINLEFCFNCTNDRRDILNAIKRVQYRGGLTHTTDATKCACQTMLTNECGLPFGPYTPNIDIVYLTDGYHNGPCKSNLKQELYCFHRPSRPNINTYAIAIGNPAYESVQALENPRNSGNSHIFNVADFTELKELFRLVLKVLKQVDSKGKPKFDCISQDLRPCRR